MNSPLRKRQIRRRRLEALEGILFTAGMMTVVVALCVLLVVTV